MPYREFTDTAGVVWRAWDTYPSSASNVRAVYAGGWLGFENGSERRRLHPVPSGWADATDAELAQYLANAAPVALHRTETYLSAVRPVPMEPGAEPAHAPAEDDGTHHALKQATHTVVERARAVLQMVSQTLSHTRDEDRKG